MVSLKEQIIKEAKRVEEDSLYSSKGHFAGADHWRNIHSQLGIPSAILAAIAGASALSNYNNTLAGLFALIVAALTTVMTFLNPNEKATLHLNAGNRYHALRNKARVFYEVECCGKRARVVELTKRLQTLMSSRDELTLNSPQIPEWAYNKARKGIEKGEVGFTIANQGNITS